MARSKSTTASAPQAEAEAPVPAAAETTQDEQATVRGRLVRDPELRKTPSGLSVTTIRLAVNHEDAETTFLNCSVWRKTADAVYTFKRKGHLVEVIGRLQDGRPWTGRDGVERSEPELVARSVQFINTRPQTPADDKAVA